MCLSKVNRNRPNEENWESLGNYLSGKGIELSDDQKCLAAVGDLATVKYVLEQIQSQLINPLDEDLNTSAEESKERNYQESEYEF